MKITCISASNMIHRKKCHSTSYKICGMMIEELQKRYNRCTASIIDLRDYTLSPCTGCGQCFGVKRCAIDNGFNEIYQSIISSDLLFIVSPHYAPIPAKLSIVLEKAEQISFLPWNKDNSYQAETYGIPTGIISHGGGSDWALKSYKSMVNDTIANALDTIQLKTIPLNQEWNTGISLPVKHVTNSDEHIFPTQEYDWDFLRQKISDYVDAACAAAAFAK